jgi:hypothetical protein
MMRLNRYISTAALLLALGATAPATAGAHTGGRPAVRPNPDEQVLMTQAKPAKLNPASTVVRPNPDEQASDSFPISPPTTPVVVRFTGAKDGFDWGDAGIAAAAGIGFAALAAAAVLAVTQRRRHGASASATAH